METDSEVCNSVPVAAPVVDSTGLAELDEGYEPDVDSATNMPAVLAALEDSTTPANTRIIVDFVGTKILFYCACVYSAETTKLIAQSFLAAIRTHKLQPGETMEVIAEKFVVAAIERIVGDPATKITASAKAVTNTRTHLHPMELRKCFETKLDAPFQTSINVGLEKIDTFADYFAKVKEIEDTPYSPITTPVPTTPGPATSNPPPRTPEPATPVKLVQTQTPPEIVLEDKTPPPRTYFTQKSVAVSGGGAKVDLVYTRNDATAAGNLFSQEPETLNIRYMKRRSAMQDSQDSAFCASSGGLTLNDKSIGHGKEEVINITGSKGKAAPRRFLKSTYGSNANDSSAFAQCIQEAQ